MRQSSRQMVTSLKAAGEATRLRILLLLDGNELNVKDLTAILGQSQPRISRHLKLLVEAALVERFREGSWVFFRLAEAAGAGATARFLCTSVDPDDPVIARDRDRVAAVRRERAEAAQAYFAAHASEWDSIRALHVAEADVETRMREVMGPGPFELLVDLGTGTGRMLELFADRVRRGIGIDVNQAMLAYARAKLESGGLGHCRVRQADLYDVPVADGQADAVVLHQVLHFLEDPARAIHEAARLLAPGGRLLIVDFAPHDLEFLREEHAHRRLGFSREQLDQWAGAAGLEGSRFEALTPRPRGRSDVAQKLTVSVWLGQRPREASTRPKSKNVEMAA
jgi:ArsR family transcriptional regulator